MKVLLIAHGHPDINVGGGEKACYILFKALKRMPGVEAVFLGRGEDISGISGCFVSAYPGREDEYFLHTSMTDAFMLTCERTETIRAFTEFLNEVKPDVIHFHHYIHLGLELLLVARQTLPNATIALTLHEYIAMCYRDGQMIKTTGNRLCFSSNPLDCSRCFTDRNPTEFFLRERYVKRFFAEVDFFVVPSKFLRDRYIQWGLPESKMVLLPYGTELHTLARAEEESTNELPNTFGFYGQINNYKGLDVIVDAVSVMTEKERSRIHVEIFGNVTQVDEARKQKLDEGFKKFRSTIRFNGPYQAQELSRLMRRVHWVIVPSVWWENAPLVIDEAFALGKPVICSNIGGMAEKVRDGIDGLHFDVGNHRSLARLMLKYSNDRAAYDLLQKNIRLPVAIEEIAARHVELYRQPERETAAA